MRKQRKTKEQKFIEEIIQYGIDWKRIIGYNNKTNNVIHINLVNGVTYEKD